MSMRNSRVELLRVFLMILIVFYHLIVHGKYAILDSLEGWTFTPFDAGLVTIINFHVNCFILISGYYSIRLNIKRIISFWMILVFYGLLNIFITYFVTNGFQVRELLDVLLRPYSLGYFTLNYFWLMLLSPFLNCCNQLKRSLLVGIIVLLFFTQSGIVNMTLGRGFSDLSQFIMVYLMGRYLHLYPIELLRTRNKDILALSLFLSWLIGVGSGFIGNPAERRLFLYCNPLSILNAILVFYLFENKPFFSSFINRLSAGVFAVYILTDCNELLSHKLDAIIYKSVVNSVPESVAYFVLLLISIVIVMSICCFDVIRRYITGHLEYKVINILEGKWQRVKSFL